MKTSLFIFSLIAISTTMIKAADVPLVDLASYRTSTIMIDMRYASCRNCTGKQLMRRPRCMVLLEVAEALWKVQEELQSYGLSLLIWNAYEAPSVRHYMKELFEGTGITTDDEGHARGTAVDVTLVLADGTLIPMPTDFDCVTREACRSCSTLPEHITNNRQVLEDMMVKYGFEPGNDWWHFNYAMRTSAPVLDIEV